MMDPRMAKQADDFFSDFEKFRTAYVKFCQTPTNRPVRIAIIDTGYDPYHGGLSQVDRTDYRSWLDTQGSPSDSYGHGTYCTFLAHKVAPRASVHVLQAFRGKDIGLEEARNIPKV